MSAYSNVTEEDLINLRKLAEQQKNERALKIKNRILKQTHDDKLAESLSPITKKLDEVKETTQKLGDVIKKSKPEAPQLPIENTPTIHPGIENIPVHQPIEDNEGSVYDVKLENALNKMVDNKGLFKTYYDQQHGWMMNNIPIKSSGGTEVEIKKKNII